MRTIPYAYIHGIKRTGNLTNSLPQAAWEPFHVANMVLRCYMRSILFCKLGIRGYMRSIPFCLHGILMREPFPVHHSIERTGNPWNACLSCLMLHKNHSLINMHERYEEATWEPFPFVNMVLRGYMRSIPFCIHGKEATWEQFLLQKWHYEATWDPVPFVYMVLRGCMKTIPFAYMV
jgi:hypothetical protein